MTVLFEKKRFSGFQTSISMLPFLSLYFLLFWEVRGAEFMDKHLEHINHQRTITLSGRKHLVTIIFWKSVRRSDQGAGKVAR